MKFGQLMSQKKNCDLKHFSRPFCVCKELGITTTKNDIFEARYLHYVSNSKTIKICPNQHAYLLKVMDSLKIKKDLEEVSRTHISYKFLIKNSFLILHKLAKFHYHTVFISQVIQ